jgi:hypothetical protein
MQAYTLIADSGSTKAEWCLLEEKQLLQTVFTKGISPYFLNQAQIAALLEQELLPQLKGIKPDQICYYGTGCAAEANRKIVEAALRQTFSNAHMSVTHDLMGGTSHLRVQAGRGLHLRNRFQFRFL